MVACLHIAAADALYVVVEALVAANRTAILTFALSTRLPSIFNNRVFVQVGALMTDQTFPTCSGALPSIRTKFCAAPSQATSQSSNRLNSISL
jgi:hypothetical protein